MNADPLGGWVPQRAHDVVSDAADADRLCAGITTAIEAAVADEGTDRIAVRLTGRLAPTILATLSVEALGCERVMGVIVREPGRPDGALDEAVHDAEELVIDYAILEAERIGDAVHEELDRASPDGSSCGVPTKVEEVSRRDGPTSSVDRTASWLAAPIAGAAAAGIDATVAGSLTRSDLLTDPGVIPGRDGATVQPLAGVYDAELAAIAERIGVRTVRHDGSDVERSIVSETGPGTAGTLPGIDGPATRDRLLHRLVDRGEPVEAAAEAEGVDASAVEGLVRHCRNVLATRLWPGRFTGGRRPGRSR